MRVETHTLLMDGLVRGSTGKARWSARRSMMVIIAVCGSVWLGAGSLIMLAQG